MVAANHVIKNDWAVNMHSLPFLSTTGLLSAPGPGFEVSVLLRMTLWISFPKNLVCFSPPCTLLSSGMADTLFIQMWSIPCWCGSDLYRGLLLMGTEPLQEQLVLLVAELPQQLSSECSFLCFCVYPGMLVIIQSQRERLTLQIHYFKVSHYQALLYI